MIMNMKKYENPMLQVISIKNNDILTQSGRFGISTSTQLAGDRFRDDDWDAGY